MLNYWVTVICKVPDALSVESVAVMVTVPVVPPIVPVEPLVMLMMLELLDVNVVDPVVSVPFSVDVKVIWVFAGLVAKLMVVPKLEVMVSVVDLPTVSVTDPETTDPLVDCAAACTVDETVLPEVGIFNAVAKPPELTFTKSGLEVTLHVADPVRFLWLPSSYVPVACSCTVLPAFGRFVDCSVETDMEVSVGSTKNPWHPTPKAMSRRTLKDTTTCSLRRLLGIKEKPSSVTLGSGQFQGLERIVADPPRLSVHLYESEGPRSN